MAPDARAAREAADNIATRRYEHKDPKLGDLNADNLLQVVVHARTSIEEIPLEVLREDVADSLVILDHYPYLIDLNRCRVIEMALDVGMTWQEIAPLLGVRTRQGAEVAYRRLRNAVKSYGKGTKDHEAERGSRQAERAEAAWLRRNTRALRSFAVRLDGFRQHLPAELHGDLDYVFQAIPATGETARPGFAADLKMLLDSLAGTSDLPPSVRAMIADGLWLLRDRPAVEVRTERPEARRRLRPAAGGRRRVSNTRRREGRDVDPR